MYKLQKKFKYPIGHRLSKHKGLCKNTHGHEFVIIVGIKSKKLDNNDMVIDFSELKKIVNEELGKFDHGLMINIHDPLFDQLCSCSEKVIKIDGDPTAERLSKYLYDVLSEKLTDSFIDMDFITVYENEDSSITYMED